jgi:hypothetical protein
VALVSLLYQMSNGRHVGRQLKRNSRDGLTSRGVMLISGFTKIRHLVQKLMKSGTDIRMNGDVDRATP